MDSKPQNLPVKTATDHTSSDDSADTSDTDSTSSVELAWRPKPYYFCAKCLQILNFPEPRDETNYLVNKESIKEKTPPAVEKEKKEVIKKRVPVKRQIKKPEAKKPRRLLLD